MSDDRLDALEARVAKLEAAQPASAAELSDKYGDPEVFSDPPRWEGPSQKGKKFSECSADYLYAMASFLEWRAGKEDEEKKLDKKGRPKSHWSRKDAKLALGWAAKKQAIGSTPAEQVNMDDIPF